MQSVALESSCENAFKIQRSVCRNLVRVFLRFEKYRFFARLPAASPCCIVAAVGDGMSHTTGVAGRFFSALGSASINVLAIAQVKATVTSEREKISEQILGRLLREDSFFRRRVHSV